MPDDARPDPDRLLAKINRDRLTAGRGRLKIFFGASAGVGKTYAMLNEARRRLAEGVDLVIGTLETHGRTETAALAEGMTLLPPREFPHRGVVLRDFDTEAALVRKPALILMDELAHSNPPGARHLKRWQDVEELLKHGIDVYSTLNVQHLESVNDMVAKFTGVIVRETVPDALFDASDDIALIDLPSDSLLERLSQGKVYVAEGAEKRAAENFFKKTNLIALRELALRRTAERVDAESEGPEHTGLRAQPLTQKILVCVGHDALSARVIRHAKRTAARSRIPWCALYVETARHDRLSDKAKLSIDRNLRLAERMGGRTVRITGSNAADEILHYARQHGYTQIILGHRHRPLRQRLWQGSLSAALIENGPGAEIITVTEKAESEPTGMGFRVRRLRRSDVFLICAAPTLATLIGLPVRGLADPHNLAMPYLIAVVAVAARLGSGPSMVTLGLGLAAFNFFFTQPYYSFEFYDKGYYFTFLMMSVTGIVVGSLAAKLALQARQARKQAHETGIFYALTRELSSVRGLDNMAGVALKHVREAFDARAVLLVPSEGGALISVPADGGPGIEMKEESVARWALQNGRLAGRGTDTLPAAKGIYVPLAAEDDVLGVLGLYPEGDRALTGSEISRSEAFAGLIASAFQRAHRAVDAEAARVESEREKLRNVLLSSVSHDLRTPLASITGAAGSALMLRERLPEEAIELLTSIRSQAARLAKLVSNLLDATSLESGNVHLNRHPYFIAEVIGAALERIGEQKGRRTIEVHVTPRLPLIKIDGLLIEQVLVNLLENAVRHTADDGTLVLLAEREDDLLRVCVSDNGSGIPSGDEDKIFEKFYSRGNRGDGNAGLGLAICRGIILAHDGHIYAQNNAGGGASMIFTLPGLGRADV